MTTIHHKKYSTHEKHSIYKKHSTYEKRSKNEKCLICKTDSSYEKKFNTWTSFNLRKSFKGFEPWSLAIYFSQRYFSWRYLLFQSKIFRYIYYAIWKSMSPDYFLIKTRVLERSRFNIISNESGSYKNHFWLFIIGMETLCVTLYLSLYCKVQHSSI